LTEEPSGAEPAPPPEGRELQGPPGGRIFSLEDRRAPSLYLLAWLLSVGGLALLLVAVLAAGGLGRLVLFIVGGVGFGLGLAFAAGSQIVERRDRRPDRYRGPAPLLAFGIVLAWSTLLSGLLVGTGLLDPAAPIGFLGSLVAVALAYVVVVWLFVVRSGALTWRDMGWPARGPGAARWILRDAGFSIAVMLPTTLGILVLGGLLATVLGVSPPDVLPTPGSSVEALAVAIGAAIVAPVGEELFFRGFALTAWWRDLGAQTAIIRSAVLFAIVHIANIQTTSFGEGAAQALLQTLVILPVGLVLGLLFVRNGMVGAISGHVTYNTLLLLLLVLGTVLQPGSPTA
jgi:membrane protease YdiL (CAAX protease family)